MRHIALLSADAPPCNGEIRHLPPSANKPATANRPYPSLPILGAPAQSEPVGEWVCDRCGMKWQREPLPQEAL